MYTKQLENCENIEELEKALATYIVDKQVYNTNGEEVGKVATVQQNRKGKIISLTLNDGKYYLRGNVYAIGDVVIVKVERPKKVTKPRPNGVVDVPRHTVALESNNPISAQFKKNESVAKCVTHSKLPYRPTRKCGNFSFLIGKTVDKNIVNFQGETMLRKNEIITSEILRQAKISGKLIELCLHAK